MTAGGDGARSLEAAEAQLSAAETALSAAALHLERAFRSLPGGGTAQNADAFVEHVGEMRVKVLAAETAVRKARQEEDFSAVKHPDRPGG